MTPPNARSAVIRRDAVRLVPQPALIDCATAADGRPAQPIAVVPLLDGERVAGFQIRCGCGASAVVECVYAEEPKP